MLEKLTIFMNGYPGLSSYIFWTGLIYILMLIAIYMESGMNTRNRIFSIAYPLVAGLIPAIMFMLIGGNKTDLYLDNIFGFKNPLLFTEFFFWGFFAIVMAVFSLIHERKLMRSTFLFAVSLFFYWKTSGLFFLLLILSTLIDYIIGIRLEKTETGWKRKALVGSSIFSNLTILIYFKYAFFFTDAYNKIFHTKYHVVNWLAQWSNEGIGTHFSVDDILLPVGVSFFTFQTISYSIDVYRKEIKALRNILDFGFYVSFFPQLVAGPIVRANEFVPQIHQKFQLTKYEFGLAIFWILNGLIKKLVLGDYLATNFIDRVFDYPENYTGFGVFFALMFYSLQVYADFSGYTDIAIGVAILLGFKLPMNFNSPYKAKSVSDFWRRWHMSLSTWLKDYLYIPLGGNKKGTFGTFFWTFVILLFVILISDTPGLFAIIALCSAFVLSLAAYFFKPIRQTVTTNINLLITMILGGLWHGASWNFVIWGALNGFALVVHKSWKKISPYEKSTHWLANAWKITFTFVFISFTRLFFRAGDRKNTGNGMETVERMWNQLMTNWDGAAISKILANHWAVFVFFTVGMIIHLLPVKIKDGYRNFFIHTPTWAKVVIVVVVVFGVYQAISSEMQAFIYFQF